MRRWMRRIPDDMTVLNGLRNGPSHPPLSVTQIIGYGRVRAQSAGGEEQAVKHRQEASKATTPLCSDNAPSAQDKSPLDSRRPLRPWLQEPNQRPFHTGLRFCEKAIGPSM